MRPVACSFGKVGWNTSWESEQSEKQAPKPPGVVVLCSKTGIRERQAKNDPNCLESCRSWIETCRRDKCGRPPLDKVVGEKVRSVAH